MEKRLGFVHEARLDVGPRVDSREPGGAVTIALCGAVEHEGSCRWPHNNSIDTSQEPALFRTVFVCSEGDSPQVREKIERALQSESGWAVTSSGPSILDQPERELVSRLDRTV
jgi:hypothetical protein